MPLPASTPGPMPLSLSLTCHLSPSLAALSSFPRHPPRTLLRSAPRGSFPRSWLQPVDTPRKREKEREREGGECTRCIPEQGCAIASREREGEPLQGQDGSGMTVPMAGNIRARRCWPRDLGNEVAVARAELYARLIFPR